MDYGADELIEVLVHLGMFGMIPLTLVVVFVVDAARSRKGAKSDGGEMRCRGGRRVSHTTRTIDSNY
jgi:hypothetical protein